MPTSQSQQRSKHIQRRIVYTLYPQYLLVFLVQAFGAVVVFLVEEVVIDLTNPVNRNRKRAVASLPAENLLGEPGGINPSA